MVLISQDFHFKGKAQNRKKRLALLLLNERINLENDLLTFFKIQREQTLQKQWQELQHKTNLINTNHAHQSGTRNNLYNSKRSKKQYADSLKYQIQMKLKMKTLKLEKENYLNQFRSLKFETDLTDRKQIPNKNDFLEQYKHQIDCNRKKKLLETEMKNKEKEQLELAEKAFLEEKNENEKQMWKEKLYLKNFFDKQIIGKQKMREELNEKERLLNEFEITMSSMALQNKTKNQVDYNENCLNYMKYRKSLKTMQQNREAIRDKLFEHEYEKITALQTDRKKTKYNAQPVNPNNSVLLNKFMSKRQQEISKLQDNDSPSFLDKLFVDQLHIAKKKSHVA